MCLQQECLWAYKVVVLNCLRILLKQVPRDKPSILFEWFLKILIPKMLLGFLESFMFCYCSLPRKGLESYPFGQFNILTWNIYAIITNWWETCTYVKINNNKTNLTLHQFEMIVNRDVRIVILIYRWLNMHMYLVYCKSKEIFDTTLLCM